MELTDQELRAAFESCALPMAEWTHRAHVRMAFLWVRENDFATALDGMRQAIKRYNASQHTPETLRRGYHETTTVAFMRLVWHAFQQTPDRTDSHAFCTAHPALLNQRLLEEYYSPERLWTAAAKTAFVTPDLQPLPGA